MTTTTIVELDRRTEIRQARAEISREMHGEAAESLRNFMKAGLQRGDILGPDTSTLAEGLTVETRSSSDYDERRAASKSAYLASASFWREIVRDVLTEFAYTEAHFEQRYAEQESLPSEAYAAVACYLAYGFWWQIGHFNLLTERWERRSWFIEPVMRWVQSEMVNAFEGWAQRVEERAG